MAGPYPTALYTQQTTRGTVLNYAPSALEQQLPVRMFTVPYIVTGTEASGEFLNLGFPKIPNMKIIPELSRVVCPSGAGAAMVMTLQKVDTAGTRTALTAAATQVAANSVAFARPATPTVPDVSVEDFLGVVLGTVTTKTATTVVNFEIAYTSTDAP